jgi:hypothetical protein
MEEDKCGKAVFFGVRSFAACYLGEVKGFQGVQV